MTELSPDARHLLEKVGGGDGPSAARRARVKSRLAAQLSAAGMALTAAQLAAAAGNEASTVAAAAATAKGALAVGTVALWLAGGALAGTLVMVPVTLKQGAQSSGSVSAPVDTSPSRDGAAKARAVPPAEEVTAPSQNAITAEKHVALPAEVPALPRRASRSEAVATDPRTAKPTDAAPLRANVGAETALLESAQRELAMGKGERALELLDRHAAQFPTAVLSEERAFARVIALCQIGRTAEARVSAEAFLRAAPRSPLLPRLRKSCAFSANSRSGGELP